MEVFKEAFTALVLLTMGRSAAVGQDCGVLLEVVDYEPQMNKKTRE